ncbi:PEP-CTERM sorting domain-containing protein [Aliiglaciecola sp. SL4]|uniref:PEP-CTERM sorting domain-containing protein n=1 Tax=Aliiglaciecola sp. SL4 TaxID=3239806 RepID=UPI00355B9828
MIKKIIAGLSLLGMSLSAQSAIIIDESNITGADMAGLEVTAFFEGGSTETAIWSAFPDVILGTGDPIADAEGFSGGVYGTGWSLTQQGFSSGNANSAGDVLGAWTLSNESASSGIFAFVVSGMDSLIAFDIDSDNIDTPYSGVGVGFASATAVDDIIYADQVNSEYDDLFFTLAVLFDTAPLVAGEELKFVADTETLKVPEPATTAMILTGLLFGAARLRARK